MNFGQFGPKKREWQEGLSAGMSILGDLPGGIILPSAHAWLKVEVHPFSWFQEKGMPTDKGGTDGTKVFYCQEYLESAPNQEIAFLIGHETLHVMLLHPWSRGGRDHMLSNIAMDHCINRILGDWGLSCPPGVIPPWENSEDSWMEIYEKLLKNAKKITISYDSLMDADSSPGNSDAEGGGEKMTQEKMQGIIMRAAQQAKSMLGDDMRKFPGFLKRMVEGITQPKVSWQSHLRRFVQQAMGVSRHTWTKPKRRYLSSGIYLPSQKGVAIDRICIMNDTSGSISNEDFAVVVAEVQAIRDEFNVEKTEVWHVDTKVAGYETFSRDEELRITPMGGGGTDFRSFFEEMEKNPPKFLIAFSDMYATFPEDCSFPVMWVTGESNPEGPFGEMIRIGGR